MEHKLASTLVKQALQGLTQAPPEVVNNPTDTNTVGQFAWNNKNPDKALELVAKSTGLTGLSSATNYRNNQAAWDRAKYYLAPGLMAGGGVLGGYALYQALRRDVDPKKPRLANVDRAQQAQATTSELNVPYANTIKEAAGTGIVSNVLGYGYDALSRFYDAIKGSGAGANNAFDATLNPNFTVPLLGLAPIAAYGGYQLSRRLKPNKAEALDASLKGEIGEFNQALNKEYTTKDAAMHACAGLLDGLEELFEKNALDPWAAVKSLVYPAGIIGGASSGLLTYNLMKRMDPERLAYQAAKDAYRRNQMVQKPKLKVTSVDPNENPDDLAGLSSSDTLMVPMPAISPGYQTKASDYVADFERDTGLPISVFNNWYLGLSETEKVASFVNMVKQAQLDQQQILQIANDPVKVQALHKIVVQQDPAGKYAKMTPQAFAADIVDNVNGTFSGPVAIKKINNLLAASPEAQKALGVSVPPPPAGQTAPTGSTGEAVSGVVADTGKDMLNKTMGWIMDNPGKAIGAIIGLLGMGTGSTALGMLGLIGALFGDDIWKMAQPYIDKFLGGSVDTATLKAQADAAKPPTDGVGDYAKNHPPTGQAQGAALTDVSQKAVETGNNAIKRIDNAMSGQPGQEIPKIPTPPLPPAEATGGPAEMQPPTPPTGAPQGLEGQGTEGGELPQLPGGGSTPAAPASLAPSTDSMAMARVNQQTLAPRPDAGAAAFQSTEGTSLTSPEAQQIKNAPQQGSAKSPAEVKPPTPPAPKPGGPLAGMGTEGGEMPQGLAGAGSVPPPPVRNTGNALQSKPIAPPAAAPQQTAAAPAAGAPQAPTSGAQQAPPVGVPDIVKQPFANNPLSTK
jgi:hypothetical protein